MAGPDDNICRDHSGCMSRLNVLESTDKDQWKEIGVMRNRMDQVLSRINVVLGGIVVACILLVINMAVK